MSFGGLLSLLGRCLSSLRLLFFRLSTFRMIGYKRNILSLVQVIKDEMELWKVSNSISHKKNRVLYYN